MAVATAAAMEPTAAALASDLAAARAVVMVVAEARVEMVEAAREVEGRGRPHCNTCRSTLG